MPSGAEKSHPHPYLSLLSAPSFTSELVHLKKPQGCCWVLCCFLKYGLKNQYKSGAKPGVRCKSSSWSELLTIQLSEILGFPPFLIDFFPPFTLLLFPFPPFLIHASACHFFNPHRNSLQWGSHDGWRYPVWIIPWFLCLIGWRHCVSLPGLNVAKHLSLLFDSHAWLEAHQLQRKPFALAVHLQMLEAPVRASFWVCFITIKLAVVGN